MHAREANIYRFKTDPKCKIFLIHPKSGGAGLNLTEANHVILVEAWWNSVVPNQALSRSWRFGQIRQVTVHRLWIKESIEMAMQEMVERKNEITAEYLGLSSEDEEFLENQKHEKMDKTTVERILFSDEIKCYTE